jgi:hypothetical protein
MEKTLNLNNNIDFENKYSKEMNNKTANLQIDREWTPRTQLREQGNTSRMAPIQENLVKNNSNNKLVKSTDTKNIFSSSPIAKLQEEGNIAKLSKFISDKNSHEFGEMATDYRLNREINLYDKKSIKSNFLEDRDLFYKFSNVNEQLDISNFPHTNEEYALGMPIYNSQILNNKKSLLTNPYINESDDTKFTSINYTLDSNNMYEELKNDEKQATPGNKKVYDFTNIAYNNTNTNTESNLLCKIEKEIAEYEYIINMSKKSNFLVDINSPYAIGYIWKILLLLCKNPSLEKLLKLLNIKNRENLLNDMKNYSHVFEKYGNIELLMPINTDQVLNSNFVNKIEDTYKIKITNSDKIKANKVRMNLNYSVDIEIPEEYNPKIVHEFMINYTKNKFKFIELNNVPVTTIIMDNIVLLEIKLCDNNVLGFVHDINKENLRELPYDLILKNKDINYVVKRLIIPKINKSSNIHYSKKYEDELKNIHLGELIYSRLYDIDIVTKINLDVKITKEKVELKKEENKKIELVNINHKCYYYLKNEEISKILINGMINYE